MDQKTQDIFRDYVKFQKTQKSLAADIIVFILKHSSVNFTSFQQHLEERFWNWQDDKKIAVQMATKAIQTIYLGKADNFVEPLHTSKDENFEYAHQLFLKTLEHDEELNKLTI